MAQRSDGRAGADEVQADDAQAGQRFMRLVEQFAPGSRLLRHWALPGGMSAQTDALLVVDAGGVPRRWVVRRGGGGADALRHEFRVLQLTHAQGLATPQPYFLDTSGEIFAAPYLVMAYIEGAPTFARADGLAYARQAAAHLVQLHRCTIDPAALPFLPQAAPLHPVHTAGPPEPTLQVAHLWATLAPLWPLVPKHAPRLLHGDFWPGNHLWHAGRLVAVVDWEDAQVGDPLCDLAISRLDICCIFGAAAMACFTDAYQAALGLDDSHLPAWDLWAALRLVRMAAGDFAGWAAFYPPVGRADITAASLHAQYQAFVGAALARLESTHL